MKNVPLFKIYWDKTDIESINSAIKQGANWAIGKHVEKFEAELKKYHNVEFCITTNSGTSALHSLLLAYGIGKGDEIIVPSFSFIATANAPLFVGAKPIFADIEDKTYGLDPKEVHNKITNKTRAIIAVHYGGNPCCIQELKKIAKDNKIILIEDAAEALGSKVNKDYIGAFGDSSILSFCQNKIISTGEGGAVLTNDKKLYNKLLLFRSHGRNDNNKYFNSPYGGEYIQLGYNFRMSNISAALGLSQLKKINKIINMRRRIASVYIQQLKQYSDIVTTPFTDERNRHVYQLFTLRFNIDTKKRDALINYFTKNGISSKIYFEPIHTTFFYKQILKYSIKLPVTEKISSQVLSIPIYPDLKPNQQEYIGNKLIKYIEEEL